MHLRTRVLLLTTAFALTLFAITFGLSWRAHVEQTRWSRLVGVEMQSTAALEELIRAHNAFRAGRATQSYELVAQLIDRPFLADATALRQRVGRFQRLTDDREATPQQFDAASLQVINAAQELITQRKLEIAGQVPRLERDTRGLMLAGLAIAWIIVLCSFAAVQLTLHRVVRPLEDLVRASDRVAAGDLNARAPIGGDYEIARLGTAFNQMADKLRAHARTDDLTGLPNFRAFRERIEEEIGRAVRYPDHFGVLVLDLDRFKQYNDRFGHLAGNEALQRVARAIRVTVRAVDFPARYGGEEFAVIVPRIDAAALASMAERIRAAVEAMPAPRDGARLTISIGAAIYPLDGKTIDDLFHTADERLYQAKRDGRNRVVSRAPAQRSADRQSA
ncbi:MAG TPA: diguanylate cyclase [Thermoanaerobaculia bacterium]|jgi:diguanylate cyclase (GGDEF)-like protein